MFSGGFDLKVMRAAPEAAGGSSPTAARCSRRIFGSEVPVVVACPGHAVAAGALLLLSADERIGARGSFRIGLIETADRHGAATMGGRAVGGAALAPPSSSIATVGARIYDPDGAVDAGFLDARRRPRRARGDARSRRRSAGPSLPRAAYRGQVPHEPRRACSAGSPTRSPPTGAGPSTSHSSDADP